MMKINKFRLDLTDIPFEKEALVTYLHNHLQLWCDKRLCTTNYGITELTTVCVCNKFESTLCAPETYCGSKFRVISLQINYMYMTGVTACPCFKSWCLVTFPRCPIFASLNIPCTYLKRTYLKQLHISNLIAGVNETRSAQYRQSTTFQHYM